MVSVLEAIMFLQLITGFGVVAITVVVAAAFIEIGIASLKRVGPWLAQRPHARKTTLALVGITLWLLATLSAAVWIWAVAFIAVGEFQELEPALYFAFAAFTTLGFGDVTLSETWRLLSGVAAANGLLLFGLSTAFLVESFSSLRQAQAQQIGR